MEAERFDDLGQRRLAKVPEGAPRCTLKQRSGILVLCDQVDGLLVGMELASLAARSHKDVDGRAVLDGEAHPDVGIADDKSLATL